MKPLRVALCVTTYTFGSMLTLPAQQPEGPTPPPKPPHGRPAPRLLSALDTDQNGVISAEEMAHAATALRTLDQNADGQLTSEEIGPPPPPAPLPPHHPRGEGHGSPTPPHARSHDKGPDHRPDKPVRTFPGRGSSPLVAALDTDRDHTLSSAEIEAATAALKTLDRNGDGQLTREELAPPRRPREGFDRRQPGRGFKGRPGAPGGPIDPPAPGERHPEDHSVDEAAPE